jgi:hypothetical protein
LTDLELINFKNVFFLNFEELVRRRTEVEIVQVEWEWCGGFNRDNFK